jgi:hypothetical protein
MSVFNEKEYTSKQYWGLPENILKKYHVIFLSGHLLWGIPQKCSKIPFDKNRLRNSRGSDIYIFEKKFGINIKTFFREKRGFSTFKKSIEIK